MWSVCVFSEKTFINSIPELVPKGPEGIVEPGKILHQLTALAGAEAGIPKKDLPPERKAELKAFFDRAK